MANVAMIQVLLVKSDTPFRSVLADALAGEGFDVSAAETARQALDMLRGNPYHVLVVADTGSQEDRSDLALIKEAVAFYPAIVPIAISADASVERVVDMMKSGAQDYLVKPFSPEDLCGSIRRALSFSRMAKESSPVSDSPRSRMGNIIGKSAVMQRVFELVGTIARGNSTVLITGETGTGKELIAQAIHSVSDRRDEKIVSINCGAIPENLLESELFGHVKGAFTGAHQTRIGRFEQANGGTIFLDEIGTMSLSLQVKLLRVLQEREFERVGGLDKVKVDVRIIAATSANLKEMTARGEFRKDL